MMRLRRISQWSALLLLLILPMLSRGSALYQAYGAGASHVDALTNSWEGFLYDAFAFLFGWLDDAAGMAAQFQGGYWSITLFGVTFNDPLAAIGHMVARGAVHWPLIAGALVAVALAVIAGRAFCGWICPVNTILEINDALRNWIERRVTHIRLPRWLPDLRPRVLVLAAGLIVSAVAGFNVFAFILPYAGLARDWHLAVYGAGVGAGFFFIVVLLAVELLAAPRLWCRSLCPTGLVLGWLGKRRIVGIARKPEGECLSGCRLCLTTCRFGVAPRDEIDTDQCMLCNQCVTHCPSDVLEITVTRPRLAPWTRRGLAGLALAALVGLAPFAADAHHIKGMPHYGYLENYPQTPTYEKRAAAPPYEVSVVAYVLEGIDRDRSETPNDAMIYVSLAEQGSRKPYKGRLEVELRPVGGGAAIRRSFKAPLEETVYRLRATLAADDYDVVVRVPEPETIGVVRLSLGAAINWWLISSLAVGAFAVAWIGAVVYRRRRVSVVHSPGE